MVQNLAPSARVMDWACLGSGGRWVGKLFEWAKNLFMGLPFEKLLDVGTP